MAIKTINATFWKQSSGLTGQNLTQSNQTKFARVAKKYKKVTEKSLSKTRFIKLVGLEQDKSKRNLVLELVALVLPLLRCYLLRLIRNLMGLNTLLILVHSK